MQPLQPYVVPRRSATLFGLDTIPDLKSHEWLLVRPDNIVSWDFRKIPAGRDKRLEAGKTSPGG